MACLGFYQLDLKRLDILPKTKNSAINKVFISHLLLFLRTDILLAEANDVARAGWKVVFGSADQQTDNR